MEESEILNPVTSIGKGSQEENIYEYVDTHIEGLTIDDDSSADELEYLELSENIINDGLGTEVTDSEDNTGDAKTVNALLNWHEILAPAKVEELNRHIDLKVTEKEKQLLKASWNIINNYTVDPDLFLHNSTNILELNEELSKLDSNESPNEFGFDHAPSEFFYDQFYNNLLELNPSLEIEYPTLQHQAKGFSTVLSKTVESFDDMDKLDVYLQKLGKRHSRILGIGTLSFELMGEAFSKTIQERLGLYHTLEIQKAWSTIYVFLANKIIASGIDPAIRSLKQEEEVVLDAPMFYSNNPSESIPQTEKPNNIQPPNNYTSINMNKNVRTYKKKNIKPGLSSLPDNKMQKSTTNTSINNNKQIVDYNKILKKKECVIM